MASWRTKRLIKSRQGVTANLTNFHINSLYLEKESCQDSEAVEMILLFLECLSVEKGILKLMPARNVSGWNQLYMFFCHLSKHVFKQFDKERHNHKLNTSRYPIDTDKNSVINRLTLHGMHVAFARVCDIITYLWMMLGSVHIKKWIDITQCMYCTWCSITWVTGWHEKKVCDLWKWLQNEYECQKYIHKLCWSCHKLCILIPFLNQSRLIKKKTKKIYTEIFAKLTILAIYKDV